MALEGVGGGGRPAYGPVFMHEIKLTIIGRFIFESIMHVKRLVSIQTIRLFNIIIRKCELTVRVTTYRL